MYRIVLLSCALCPPRARAIECDRPVPKNRLLSSDKHPKIGRRMAQSLLSPCAGPQISDGRHSGRFLACQYLLGRKDSIYSIAYMYTLLYTCSAGYTIQGRVHHPLLAELEKKRTVFYSFSSGMPQKQLGKQFHSHTESKQNQGSVTLISGGS